MREDAGPNAVGAEANPSQRDAEEDERRKRAENPVAEAEHEPADDHRRDPAEELERAHPEPAEEELLRERHDRADDDAVQEERSSVLGLPLIGGEALFAPSVEERLQHEADDEHPDDETDGDADPPPAKRVQAERARGPRVREGKREGEADE